MVMFSYSFQQLMFMFYIFCNIGWVQESTIESIYHKRLINRGFLKGPYIPIYGVGGMTILFLCMPFRNNGFCVYFVGLVGCTILEYFVGWLMEKLFHKQFWDYSMLKLTYKNRISLLSSLFWGLLSLFMVYVLYGIMDLLVNFTDPVFMLIYDIVMGTIMSVDAVISIAGQAMFRERIKKLPYEKARKMVTDKFIQLGGAVMKRRERFNILLSRMKFRVDDVMDDEIEDPEEETESESYSRNDEEGEVNEG